MIRADSRSQLKPKKDALLFDWDRWIPLATREVQTRAYFEFLDKAPAKDTTEKRFRFFTMAGLLDGLAKSGRLIGDVVECGCYMGHSSYIIASILRERGFTGTFHIFDSFEGLSDATEEDLQPIADGPSREELFRLSGPKDGKRRFGYGLDRVKRNLAGFEFVEFHPGWIPDRFHEIADKRFSFINLDLDLYQPTLDSLRFLYPRLDNGGMVFLDDYGVNSWPGCKRAVDEWMADKCPSLTFTIPGMGLAIIK